MAFTEYGGAMVSAVLNSERAIQMSIPIVRALVKLREMLASNMKLAREIDRIGASQIQHAHAIREQGAIPISVVRDVGKLKAPPITRAMGFFARSPEKKRIKISFRMAPHRV